MKQEASDVVWRVGRALFAGQFEKVLRHGLRSARVGEASHPGPSSCLRLRRATSVVAVAPTHVDSGRFSALDEDFSDSEVDEGGREAQPLSANVESSNVGRVPAEVIAMFDAEGPTVGRRRLVLVSSGGENHVRRPKRSPMLRAPRC